MKKKIVLWLSAICYLFVFAGCGQEAADGKGKNAEELILTGEYAPIAKFAMLSLPGELSPNEGDYFYADGEIIYLETEKVEEEEGYGHYEKKLLAVSTDDGAGAPRLVAEGSDGAYICHFFVDKKDSLYLYETKGYYDYDLGNRVDYFYLRKIDADGKEVYRTDLTELMESLTGECVKGYVDEKGNIALINFSTEQVFFLDSAGQYQGVADAGIVGGITIHHNTNNIVRMGERYFLWKVEVDLAGGSIDLWEVDFRQKLIRNKITINMSSLAKASASWDYVLLDGGDMGLLVSTKDVLWQYDLETGEAVEIFRWDDENIDVDGRFVAQINWGSADEGGIPMDVFVYEDCNGLEYVAPMAVSIRYVDKGRIPERQAVSIGIDNNLGNIEKLVRRFNRLNPEYEAVLAIYSPNRLKELLMYGEEVPDLLDVTGIGTEWLETKNLLEDLAPYFKKSENISREDILPEIWELLERDGKLASMATSFTIRTMTTTADVPEDGWDYGQFLGLVEQYPESRYFNRYDGMQMWGVVSSTGLDLFVDWKKMKCSFNSDEFKELVGKINSRDYPRRQWQNGTAAEELERLITKQVLFQYTNYGSPYDYDKMQAVTGGAVKCVGFPTADGEPRFLFSASQNLAIYAYSSNKEGAWAFLEFILSEYEQSWYSSEKSVFPVRKDSFEEYLLRPRRAMNVETGIAALEDTPAKLRYMVEHLGMNRNAADEINAILSEELQAYFAGDKNVDEAAEIIQSRVQLYLDEM